MKKILMVFATLMMVVITPAKAGLDWGVTAGWNLTKMSLDSEVLDSENHSGWFAGVKGVFTIPVVGLGIDGAVEYSQRKLSVESEDVLVSESTTKTVRSVAVPINVRYTFGFSSVAGVYVATGPQFNFNIGSKEMSNYTLKNSDLSWNIGAGVKVLSHFEIGAAYNIPLGKTAEYKNIDASDIKLTDAKSNTWQVSATYYF